MRSGSPSTADIIRNVGHVREVPGADMLLFEGHTAPRRPMRAVRLKDKVETTGRPLFGKEAGDIPASGSVIFCGRLDHIFRLRWRASLAGTLTYRS
jgi:hypothetical protein